MAIFSKHECEKMDGFVKKETVSIWLCDAPHFPEGSRWYLHTFNKEGSIKDIIPIKNCPFCGIKLKLVGE